MKGVVAKVASTLILWWRASLLASPIVVPASTVPWRWTAPVRARMASRSVVLPLWNGPTSAMHRGPKFLVPLGPDPFCPIIASLAGREVGPGFPALSHYRLRLGGSWQGRRLWKPENLFDETRVDDLARIHAFVDQTLRLVPGDLSLDIGNIKPSLRLDKIRGCFDRSRTAVAAVGVDVARYCCRRFMRSGVRRSFGIAILAQKRRGVVGGTAAIGTNEFFDNAAPGLDHFRGNEQGTELLLIQLGIPTHQFGLICSQQFTRMRCRHDRGIDLIRADSACNSIERLHWLYSDAADVDMFDAGDLFQLIARDRAKRADRDCLVGDVIEFMQALIEPHIGCDDFRPFIVALLARLSRNRLYETLAGSIECRRREPGETEVSRARGKCFRHALIGLVGRHGEVDTLGFEVALRRRQKQRAVVGQALRADSDALLRGCRQCDSDDRDDHRNPKANHARRLAGSCIRESEYGLDQSPRRRPK